jgi:hypothetical protein
LPWKTVRDLIGGSLQARFIALAEGSAPWPCEMPAANTVKLKLAESGGGGQGGTGGGFAGGTGTGAGTKTLVAQATLEPSEIQDLGDLIPQLLEIKNNANAPLVFRVQIEFGDGSQKPDLPVQDGKHKRSLFLAVRNANCRQSFEFSESRTVRCQPFRVVRRSPRATPLGRQAG